MSEFIDSWPHKIFNSNLHNFEELCLEAFQYQYQNNRIYREYAQFWNILDADTIHSVNEIPFLPIEFFKTHEVRTGMIPILKTFESSGTGMSGNSKHFIADLNIYEQSIFLNFESTFGAIENCCILGLLPSYLEKENSSLVYMVQALMKKSKHPLNGFYLYEHQELANKIAMLESKNEPYILFGVSFALLDFVAKFSIPIQSGKIIETGGMKGRKKEITKMELSNILNTGFRTSAIFSEYGMCELQSQFYSSIDNLYNCPPWAKVQTVDINDPKSFTKKGKTGTVRIIDLANIHSCCFIQTADLGIVHENRKFEILGRKDDSELRGCSLLIE
jgi:hypothetical protein